MKINILGLILALSLTGCEAKESSNTSIKTSVIEIQEFKNIVENGDQQQQQQLFEQIETNANKDDAVSQNLLGVIYENGYLNQSEDIEKAIVWYGKSAKQGNGIAENNIGNLYYRGQGVEKNDEIAYQYYKRAVQKNIPEAVNSIGLMYFNGSYVSADKQTACEYFKKAADLENHLGESNVANCYLNGWNGPVD